MHSVLSPIRFDFSLRNTADLQYFIKRSESNFNLFLAVQKWSEDLDWVRNYNIDTQRRFIISSIQKYNGRK